MFRRVATFLRKREVARLELGGVEQVKEEVRATRGLPMLDSAIRDLHHALRSLARTPGFSIAVVVTLGLALGANASVLALLDRLILRPLPVKEPGSLVAVHAPRLPERPSGDGPTIVISVGGAGAGLSYPLYAALRSRVPAFTGMLAQTHATATMLVEGTPVGVEGRMVTGNYFELLGVKAALGRLLTPDDDERADGSPVVLSHGLWQRQFGGDPGPAPDDSSETTRSNLCRSCSHHIRVRSCRNLARGSRLPLEAKVAEDRGFDVHSRLHSNP